MLANLYVQYHFENPNRLRILAYYTYACTTVWFFFFFFIIHAYVGINRRHSIPVIVISSCAFHIFLAWWTFITIDNETHVVGYEFSFNNKRRQTVVKILGRRKGVFYTSDMHYYAHFIVHDYTSTIQIISIRFWNFLLLEIRSNCNTLTVCACRHLWRTLYSIILQYNVLFMSTVILTPKCLHQNRVMVGRAIVFSVFTTFVFCHEHFAAHF